MNWLSVAGKLADAVNSGISLDAERCLHTVDRFSDCQACFQVCPVQAIRPGSPPTVDESSCEECLACLSICPVDAYQGKDAFPALMRCVSRLQGKSVEIICEQDSTPHEGSCSERIGLQIKGCFAGLGVGAWIILALSGLESLHLRLSFCENCRWRALRDLVSRQVRVANQILESWGCEERVEVEGKDPGTISRPLWQAGAPPLSRREMFKIVTNQSKVSLAYTLGNRVKDSSKKPGRDQRRLAFVVEHLLDRTVEGRQLPPEVNMGSLEVGEHCTACCACARICPTGALKIVSNRKEQNFQILFSPLACVGCEACMHSCPEDAIWVKRTPSTVDVFGTGHSVTLLSGKLQKCEKCRTFFAGSKTDTLCPICAGRKKNPFGSTIVMRKDKANIS
ncbi:MAG: 4Fe-4S binding protein [Anaerolineales bacterium]|nr:4Fe-4S binding protein [Anaerolineales bacterium]